MITAYKTTPPGQQYGYEIEKVVAKEERDLLVHLAPEQAFRGVPLPSETYVVEVDEKDVLSPPGKALLVKSFRPVGLVSHPLRRWGDKGDLLWATANRINQASLFTTPKDSMATVAIEVCLEAHLDAVEDEGNIDPQPYFTRSLAEALEIRNSCDRGGPGRDPNPPRLSEWQMNWRANSRDLWRNPENVPILEAAKDLAECLWMGRKLPQGLWTAMGDLVGDVALSLQHMAVFDEYRQNPWSPLVEIYLMGCWPIGPGHVEGQFVVYVPPVQEP